MSSTKARHRDIRRNHGFDQRHRVLFRRCSHERGRLRIGIQPDECVPTGSARSTPELHRIRRRRAGNAQLDRCLRRQRVQHLSEHGCRRRNHNSHPGCCQWHRHRRTGLGERHDILFRSLGRERLGRGHCVHRNVGDPERSLGRRIRPAFRRRCARLAQACYRCSALPAAASAAVPPADSHPSGKERCA